MIYNKFGNTGLEVSALGFGAGEIGDFNIDEKSVEKILNFALDNGINLIDTARGYYASEDRIGRFISNRRKEFILSTKVGYGIENEPDWSYNSVVKGVEDALVKLKTDYIDIVHLHSCSIEILNKGEVIEALLKTKKEGKIRFAAFSGENEELKFAVECGYFDSIQTSFNICDQNNFKYIFPVTNTKGIGVIAKRSIANAPWLYSEQPYGKYVEEYWKRWQKMGFRKSENWFDKALRFTAFSKGVDCSIVGTTSIEHLKQNINYINNGDLSNQDRNYIMQKYSEYDNNWLGQV